MNSIAVSRVTPEELLAMSDGDAYELIDGQLVERAMSSESSYVAGNAFFLMKSYARQTDAGWAFPADAGVQCFPGDPGKVRRPDASFVRKERLPDGPGAGFLRLAPDLVVEVLSPHDLAYEVDQKIVEYLLARVRLVWVVNPSTRQVRVHRLDGSISALGVGDELSGEDALPGFRCPVGELFAGLKPVDESHTASEEHSEPA